MEKWMKDKASKSYGGPCMFKFVHDTELKRLQRLKNTKSSVAGSMKHDNWTRQNVEKLQRQLKLLRKRESPKASDMIVPIRSVKSETTRSGLKLQLSLEDKERKHRITNNRNRRIEDYKTTIKKYSVEDSSNRILKKKTRERRTDQTNHNENGETKREKENLIPGVRSDKNAMIQDKIEDECIDDAKCQALKEKNEERKTTEETSQLSNESFTKTIASDKVQWKCKDDPHDSSKSDRNKRQGKQQNATSKLINSNMVSGSSQVNTDTNKFHPNNRRKKPLLIETKNYNTESKKQDNDEQDDILLSSPTEKNLDSSFLQQQIVSPTERKGCSIDSRLSVQNDKKRMLRTKVKSPSVNYDGNKTNVILKNVRNHRGISISALVKEHAEALVILKETERESIGKVSYTLGSHHITNGDVREEFSTTKPLRTTKTKAEKNDECHSELGNIFDECQLSEVPKNDTHAKDDGKVMKFGNLKTGQENDEYKKPKGSDEHSQKFESSVDVSESKNETTQICQEEERTQEIDALDECTNCFRTSDSNPCFEKESNPAWIEDQCNSVCSREGKPLQVDWEEIDFEDIDGSSVYTQEFEKSSNTSGSKDGDLGTNINTETLAKDKSRTGVEIQMIEKPVYFPSDYSDHEVETNREHEIDTASTCFSAGLCDVEDFPDDGGKQFSAESFFDNINSEKYSNEK